MPLYAFTCQDCHEPFDKLLRSSLALDEVRCPTCGSPNVKKQLSSFATRGGAAAPASAVTCATGST